MTVTVINTIEHFAEKYGEKIAVWAVIAIVIYLIIAQ
jgi:hypothetical protein